MWKIIFGSIAALAITAAVALFIVIIIHIRISTPVERGMAEWNTEVNQMVVTFWLLALAAITSAVLSRFLGWWNSYWSK